MAPCTHDHGAQPKIPESMHGRYKVYKAGTSKFINWLVTTAGRCCNLSTIVRSLKNVPPLYTNDSLQPQPTTYQLRTQELVALAEKVAGSDPPVTVPVNILQLLQDVISGRKECAEWYATQAVTEGSGLEKRNETHRYFLLVLQRVLKLLQDLQTRATTTSKTQPACEPKSKTKRKAPIPVINDTVSNLFAQLHVEEPAFSFPEDGVTEQAGPSHSPLTPHSFRLVEDDDDDEVFQVWCFLQDLYDVRMYVRDTWIEYSHGQVSFLLASSVTETAFGLLRCADAEFEASSSLPATDWLALLGYLGITMFTRGWAVWLFPTRGAAGVRAPSTTSTVDVVQLLCPVAGISLCDYQNDASKLCRAVKGVQRQKNVGLSALKPSGHGHPFSQALWEIGPILHDIVHTEMCQYHPADEFIQGLTQIHKKEAIPMWLIVACQIYVDMYDLLGDDFYHGIDALQTTLLEYKDTAVAVHDYRPSAFGKLGDVLDGLGTLDHVSNGMGRSQNGQGRRMAPEHRNVKDGLFATERALHAYAGATLTDLKLGMLKCGTTIANHDYYVVSVAYIYKALRAMGVLKCEWHDMNAVLVSFDGQQPVFPRCGATYDGRATAIRYENALGIPSSAATANPHRRQAAIRAAAERRAHIGITSPLLQRLSDKKNCYEKLGVGYTRSKTMEIALYTLTATAAGTGTSTSPQPPECITPLQLLETFKRSVVSQEPILNFNFIEFFLDCARLMTSLCNQLRANHAELSKPRSDINHLGLTFDLLLADPAGPIAREAGDFLNSYIETCGKKYIKSAYDKSSGRIPKANRPNLQVRQSITDPRRDLLSTILDRAGARYDYYDRILAAYHPRIILEECNGGGCHGEGCGRDGGETDPNACDGASQFVLFRSGLPSCIVEEGLIALKNDAEATSAAKDKLTDGSGDGYPGDTSDEELLRMLGGSGAQVSTNDGS